MKSCTIPAEIFQTPIIIFDRLVTFLHAAFDGYL